jgi:alpha-D-ribose 1-methylphosphonate 5-triphosphate synthase subunit PhnG
MFDAPSGTAARQAWLAILAKATVSELTECLSNAPELPDFNILRPAETGMSMVRGRIGGGGQAFNLGEMTISRCSIRDAGGRIGHGYAAGRDLAQVALIARLDAALQDEALHPAYERAVLAPLREAQAARRAATEARAAATEVKFFTLATMRS